ncbi:MAG: transglycosylase SLT domain-containing protein, partial [Trueperaceae bacterium]|nr:transglycosylase SLT domain-containing protein [Trueperaceae bacterium]
VARVVVSINGGQDRTPEVVAATLEGHGFVLAEGRAWVPARLPIDRWTRADGDPDVVVVHHPQPIGKADSLNLIVEGGLIETERVLVMDGDTVLDDGFVAAIRDGFYRLRRVREGRRWRWLLEDVALLSGAVTSLRSSSPTAASDLIRSARAAEYAFAVVVRRGQTARVGRGGVFGASRLFTVVGCGFVARADAFPMPCDTLTEDHDFTMQVQQGASSEREVELDGLHLRGFRVVVDGVERPLRDVVDAPSVTLRRTADARFEAGAAMATEDPPRLTGYLHQVERWVGGALEVVAKRAVVASRRRALTPNVRFTLLAAQFENLVGLLLLLALPGVLGLQWPLVGPGSVARAAAIWWLADVAVTGTLVFLGFWTQARVLGHGRRGSWRRALTRTVFGIGPLLLLRPINALAYATSLSTVVPRLAEWWRPRRDPKATVVWERPASAPRALHRRTVRVAGVMTSVAGTGFLLAVWPGMAADLAGRVPYRAVHGTPIVELADHAVLPVVALDAWRVPETAFSIRVAEGYGASGDVLPGEPDGGLAQVEPAPLVHAFCAPESVVRAAPERRSLTAEALAYQPLGAWGLMTLARLVPIAHPLEEAATAYDVSATHVLQVLLNESYLDPLAEGPTDDLGLSQVTADALRLLQALSTDPTSGFANPGLFARAFSVYDPEFSVCAGAAKLAWARSQPGGDDPEVAYARYVNPREGVVSGRVSDRHRPLVDAFVAVGPMAETLGAVFEAYRRDPATVAAPERALLDVAAEVASGALDVEGAYRRVAALVVDLGIEEPGFYERVLLGLYGEYARSTSPETLLAEAR